MFLFKDEGENDMNLSFRGSLDLSLYNPAKKKHLVATPLFFCTLLQLPQYIPHCSLIAKVLLTLKTWQKDSLTKNLWAGSNKFEDDHKSQWESLRAHESFRPEQEQESDLLATLILVLPYMYVWLTLALGGFFQVLFHFYIPLCTDNQDVR